RAFQMDIHQQIELLLAGIGEAGGLTDTGIVDQKIEALAVETLEQSRAQAVSETGETCTVADIQLQHQGPRAEALDLISDRLRFGRLAVEGANDVDTLCGQLQRSAAAQPAAGTGDQCEFAFHVDLPFDE